MELQELRDALESRRNENDGLTEIEERLELITIEKEMAEEKVDILQVNFSSILGSHLFLLWAFLT